MHTHVDLIGAYGLFLGIPLLFLIIVAWVYRPRARQEYDRDGEIPLQDEPAPPKAP